MQKQRHEIEVGCALTAAFAALVAVVAKGRWSAGIALDAAPRTRGAATRSNAAKS